MNTLHTRLLPLVLATTLVLPPATSRSWAVTNIFFTQFERAEGYQGGYELIGQNEWTGSGSGGNAIVTNYFIGQGQQPYIGAYAPDSGDDQLFIWRPINFDPMAAGLPLVKFSVLLSIEPSSSGEPDNFRWSVYNQNAERLFTLDFDNYFTNIYYLLDGTNDFQNTGVSFVQGADYTLTITMEFAVNRWAATLNSTLLATNLPITTTGAALNLGDVDAAWLIYDTNAPGNNYMLFDNYLITAEALPVPPPATSQVQLLGRTPNGWSLLRVFAPAESKFAVEATTNLTQWTALKTNATTGGSFDYIDTSATGLPWRFYRTRFVP